MGIQQQNIKTKKHLFSTWALGRFIPSAHWAQIRLCEKILPWVNKGVTDTFLRTSLLVFRWLCCVVSQQVLVLMF